MCRPQLPNAFSSGWHLHQSLRDRNGRNAFTPSGDALLSNQGLSFAQGLLTHAAESCLLTTPTITGYKRYRPYSLAPDRILMARDNRAAMLRVISAPGSAASRIENRVGESAANPYFYLMSQVLSGMAGLRSAAGAVAVSAPYETEAPRLPSSLAAAIDAFASSRFYRAELGDPVVDYLSFIKRAEVARFQQEVTDWEQREYFDLF
jgi:glutamine synthetase